MTDLGSGDDGWDEGFVGALPAFGGRVAPHPPFRRPAYGSRLFTATLVHETRDQTLRVFFARHCIDRAELLERLSWRVPLVRLPHVVVTVGIDLQDPVVRRLVSGSIVESLAEFGDVDATTRPLAEGAELCVRERTSG